MRKVKFFDTTLRDGEQTPGVHFSINHKIEIARQLSRLGIDIIEAGFPASSKGDFKAVSQIAHEIKGSVIAGLSRATRNDIDTAYDAVKKADGARLHIFIATSDIHMRHKLKLTRNEVLEITRDMLSYARTLTDDIQFSPEDATRSDPDFLIKVLKTAVECGASTINIPDTVGYTVPAEFAALIDRINKEVILQCDREIDLSVHCHNDLGLASANTLIAVRNGASQVETTINGLGERAGNAAFEEIVMALDVRADSFGVTHGINLSEITRTSRLVSSLSAIAVQPNKAIVGANAFLHESGIHQHGMLCDKSTYEIINPEKIGLKVSGLVLGKLSGRHAFAQRISELGYALDDEAINATFEIFKENADRKSEVADDDIRAIVNEYLDTKSGKYKLCDFQIQSGGRVKSMAMITLSYTENGEQTETSEAAVGEGPIDAAFNAINRIVGANGKIQLENYEIKAVTEGTDALGEVRVKIRENDTTYTGRSVSTDIFKASIKSYINAVNKWAATKNGSDI